MSKQLPIALLGLGTVGGGVFDVLNRNAQELQRRTGHRIYVNSVAVRNLDKARQRLHGAAGQQVQLTTDALQLASQGSEPVVCELIGGTGLARQCVLAAIHAGKHVVTANKALLATHGDEIFSLAQAKGVSVMFEAAVAGGIPIIKALREGLAANRIEWITGIINGTCNYILSAMTEQGANFDDVLKHAQQLGYAEADPSTDIDGLDAAHKLTLLASLAFGIRPQLASAHIEGLREIDATDIRYARDLGYRIKLLGITRRSANGIELRVHPTLVPTHTVLASVSGVMNAVLVQADAVGQTVYTGAGAGAEPTASSVIADLVDICRMGESGDGVPHLAFEHHALQDIPILPISQIESCYYLRARVDDQPGVLADIARALADRGISIDALIQPAAGDQQTDIVLLTHKTQESHLRQALASTLSMPSIKQPVKTIRVEHL